MLLPFLSFVLIRNSTRPVIPFRSSSLTYPEDIKPLFSHGIPNQARRFDILLYIKVAFSSAASMNIAGKGHTIIHRPQTYTARLTVVSIFAPEDKKLATQDLGTPDTGPYEIFKFVAQHLARNHLQLRGSSRTGIVGREVSGLY